MFLFDIAAHLHVLIVLFLTLTPSDSCRYSIRTSLDMNSNGFDLHQPLQQPLNTNDQMENSSSSTLPPVSTVVPDSLKNLLINKSLMQQKLKVHTSSYKKWLYQYNKILESKTKLEHHYTNKTFPPEFNNINIRIQVPKELQNTWKEIQLQEEEKFKTNLLQRKLALLTQETNSLVTKINSYKNFSEFYHLVQNQLHNLNLPLSVLQQITTNFYGEIMAIDDLINSNFEKRLDKVKQKQSRQDGAMETSDDITSLAEKVANILLSNSRKNGQGGDSKHNAAISYRQSPKPRGRSKSRTPFQNMKRKETVLHKTTGISNTKRGRTRSRTPFIQISAPQSRSLSRTRSTTRPAYTRNTNYLTQYSKRSQRERSYSRGQQRSTSSKRTNKSRDEYYRSASRQPYKKEPAQREPAPQKYANNRRNKGRGRENQGR